MDRVSVATTVVRIRFHELLRIAIATSLAFTLATALYTSVVTLAVFLLTSRFLAVTSFVMNQHLIVVL